MTPDKARSDWLGTHLLQLIILPVSSITFPSLIHHLKILNVTIRLGLHILRLLRGGIQEPRDCGSLSLLAFCLITPIVITPTKV